MGRAIDSNERVVRLLVESPCTDRIDLGEAHGEVRPDAGGKRMSGPEATVCEIEQVLPERFGGKAEKARGDREIPECLQGGGVFTSNGLLANCEGSLELVSRRLVVACLDVEVAEVREPDRDVGVFRTEGALLDPEHSRVGLLSFGELAPVGPDVGEVVEGLGDAGALRPLRVLEEPERLGEMAFRGEGIDFAQDRPEVQVDSCDAVVLGPMRRRRNGERLLKQAAGVFVPAELPVDDGDV
ncbi:MAG: hypothetical protein U0529_04410 [Thermoanaerobaculia bacterium]